MEESNTDEFEGDYAKLMRMARYRDLLNDARVNMFSNQPGKLSVNGISDIMVSADELIRNVHDPDEAVLDAKLLSISSNILKQNAEALDTNLYSFRPSIFADNLEIRTEDLIGNKLYSYAAKCFRRTPTYTYMFGTFEIDHVASPKKKVPKKLKGKLSEGHKKKPENVKTLQKQEDGVEETLHYIMKVLSTAYKCNNNRPISYLKLVINPDSFAATVENIFHVSFLLKDGYVDMNLDENELPVIEPVPRNVAESPKKTDGKIEQVILSFNMDLWEDLKKTFNIQEAMLKPSKTMPDKHPEHPQ